jgi:NAD(P)-dependent dehydrogenase (short-subunit alcohol dehydrogenase family)
MDTFVGRVALVTGASSGIGRSTALLYAKHGAKVIVSDIDERGAQETVDLIMREGGEASYIKTDVSRAVECQNLVDQTLSLWGRLDYACNNAGIGGEQNPTGDYSIESWNRVLAVNLSGAFYCMRYEIPAMLRTGGGAIVNMASILGQVGFAGSPAYVSAKHGLIGLTRTAAIEYSKANIRINAVGPAFIRTPMISALEENPETLNMLVSMHPIGRLGEPEEVAEFVIWLSSSQASFVTGNFYAVDGGYLAQ